MALRQVVGVVAAAAIVFAIMSAVTGDWSTAIIVGLIGFGAATFGVKL